MLFEFLILIIVIASVHLWEYRSDVQQYSFAQPATLDKHNDLSRLIQEKIPLAVEIGSLPWRPIIAEKANWQVQTVNGVIPISALDPKSDMRIMNPEHLASQVGLLTGLSDLDAGRPWWWVPELRDCSVDLLQGGRILPLSWITAERRWIGCCSDGPVTIWLVHSRYRRFLPENQVINPWTVSVSEAPWWGRVQYVEVTVKPGWCLGIPAHWGFSAKSEDPQSTAWIWTANQHSMMSLAVEKLTGM